MLDVIDFLERMGADAQLRHASDDEIALALAQTAVEPSLCSAILAGNSAGLQSLLKQMPLFMIMIPGPGEDEEEEEEGDEEGEGDGNETTPKQQNSRPNVVDTLVQR